MAKKLKVYNGSSWEDVTFAITPPTTNVTNSFTTNQVIDASTSVAALRITQRGTGEALRVEDETNPDSSPFVIDATGQVYVGSVNSASKLPTTRQYLNIAGTSGPGVIQLADTGNVGTLDGLIEFHDLQNTSNSAGTRNAYIAGWVEGTATANNRGGMLTFATKQDGVSNAAIPRMTITNVGFVGIGGTPTNLFTVIGSTGGEVVGAFANNNAGVNTIALRSGATGGNWANSIALQNYAGNTTYAEIRASADNQMGLFTNGSERIRINADGQVNLPNNKLIVNSTASVTGANWIDSMLHLTGDLNAANNPGLTWHAPGASAVALYHTRGWQGISVLGNSGATDTTSGRPVIRNISISTSNPSGGSDGDMWAVYV